MVEDLVAFVVLGLVGAGAWSLKPPALGFDLRAALKHPYYRLGFAFTVLILAGWATMVSAIGPRNLVKQLRGERIAPPHEIRLCQTHMDMARANLGEDEDISATDFPCPYGGTYSLDVDNSVQCSEHGVFVPEELR